MTALMQDVGVVGPVSAKDGLDLVAAAVAIYLPEGTVERLIADEGEAELTIVVRACPTYARVEQSERHGATTCGSWHRRQGWYQALGVDASDVVEVEMRWGDAACVARMRLLPAASLPSA